MRCRRDHDTSHMTRPCTFKGVHLLATPASIDSKTSERRNNSVSHKLYRLVQGVSPAVQTRWIWFVLATWWKFHQNASKLVIGRLAKRTVLLFLSENRSEHQNKSQSPMWAALEPRQTNEDCRIAWSYIDIAFQQVLAAGFSQGKTRPGLNSQQIYITLCKVLVRGSPL